MKRILTFQSLVIDSRPLDPKTLQAEGIAFMQGDLPANEHPAPTVAATSETDLLRWLVTRHSRVRGLLCRHLGLPPFASHRFATADPLLPRGCTKPGDVDWLCVDPAEPHFATVAECKRVKVVAQREGKDHHNKIPSIGEGVRQANSLAGHGFHRTYLALLIVIDGRARTENNVVFRGVADATFQRIYEVTHETKLNEDVGVMYIEVVQPSERHVNRMVQVGVCIDQPAKPREQSVSMTNRIRELLRRPE